MGKKVKAFLHIFINSVVPQNIYYGRLLKQKLTRSVFYYLVLLGAVSVFAVLIMIVQLFKNNPGNMDKCMQYSLKSIPNDFMLHVQKGILTTNQLMPVFVWFNCDDSVKLLGVIDERATRNDIFSYNAQVLATGSDLVFRYKTYTYAFTYKRYLPDIRADKNDIVTFVTQTLDVIATYVPLVAASIVFMTPLTIFALNIAYLLLSSVFVVLFFRFMKRHYTLKTVLHIGIHSSTVPIVTSLLFLLFPVRVTNTLFLFFFLFFIFQMVAVYEAHYIEPSSHHK